jgi:hypothetical protein
MMNSLIPIIGSSCLLPNPNLLHWNEETVTAICLSSFSHVLNSLTRNGISFSMFVRNVRIYESFINLLFLNRIVSNTLLGTKILFEVPILNSIKYVLGSIKYEVFEYTKYQKSIISLTKIYTVIYIQILEDLLTKSFSIYGINKSLITNLIVNKSFQNI